MSYNKKISETAVRLGEVRFCYAFVFAPSKNEDGSDGSYRVQILVPKTDTTAVSLINAAVEAAKKIGVPTKWGGKMPSAARLKLPLRDGDEEFPEDPVYGGMYFFNASSSKEIKPGVRVLENGVLSEALDGEDFYSGCYGCVTVNFYPFEKNGNVGVAAGLNNLVKTRDGEKLSGGGHSAEEDFADLVGNAKDFLD